MIGLKVKCEQIVNGGHGQGSIFSFTCKRLLSSSSSTTPCLKREDFQYILHHSSFSPWKKLIGGSDWKEHSLGKEGAERYRTQNLPNHTSPGAYELGIATSASRNLDSASVVPVYTGEASNVRARLQSYGRGGAHLASLFADIFIRGLPIVYRWAPMESKEAAQRMEAELLQSYDYAWNKRSNGHRRPHHIQPFLTHKLSFTPQFKLSTFFAILLYFRCSILAFCRPTN
ncbi:protein EFFECTOR OF TRANSCRIPTION 2-like [Salvia divinorum]|uniref:Protein EFFECTOR OF TRANSCRIPTION 2-like n=1 Tax=Salvia divinorum TaxID=28513 RepID=A0ABD1I4N7_SALDI